MSVALNDPVTVEFSEGRPVLFWWGRYAYEVISGDIFYKRVQARWWLGEGDVNRIDAEHWRVVAAHDGAEKMYDLRKDPDGWRVVLSWDD